MASVHRDPRFPKGVFYCYYTLADGRRATRSTGRRSRAQAQIVCQALQQAENEAAGGDLTKDRLKELLDETLKRLGESPIERISIKNWLEEWLAGKEGISERTRENYAQAVREFLAYLGPSGINRRLESITERDIRGFVEHLRKSGRAPGTINSIVRLQLATAFGKAKKLGKIPFNPVMATDPEKVTAAPRDTFTPEQVASLLAVAPRDWQGAILFAYTTGARLADVVNLRWPSLDLEYGVVTLAQQKTGKKTVIGLHPDFVEWLTQYPVPDEPESLVFPALSTPARWQGELSKEFAEIVEKAGVRTRLIRQRKEGKSRSLRSLSFHSFRHGAATAVFNQAALKEIARRVTGHAAGGVVDRYIHQDLEAIREATKLIPRLPKNGGGE